MTKLDEDFFGIVVLATILWPVTLAICVRDLIYKIRFVYPSK